MIKEVLLVHHTHTDIGYTHPQPVVFELHDRFIEMALDLADATVDEREDARFRWTCEVTGTTRAWWERATPFDRSRFLNAVKRGQIDIAAMQWHLTPLADLRMLVKSLENVKFFRDLGIPIRSAMNTDVNGVPWGLVDILLDHGIDGFSMSANSHMGGPVSPRPGAFRWVSPSGRELVVWNGFQYWHFANVLLRMPSSVDAVAEAMPPLLAEAESRGYPLSYLPIQITNPHHPDNATPDASLSSFVREWNDRDPEVRIRTVLLSEVFERLRGEELPRQSGDWTDYWNFGAGSSARETTVLMEGLRVLDSAHGVSSWPGKQEVREASHLDSAHNRLALYAEHTWGADCSISLPESIETYMQWSQKSAYVFDGLGHARIVLRDALQRLAKRAGGEEPTVLLYNPLPIPVATKMKLPIDPMSWALSPGVHHLQRLDGAFGNMPEEAFQWCSVSVPPLGYRTYPIGSLPLASSAGLSANDDGIASSRVSLTFNAKGGVDSFRVDGREFSGCVDGLKFGVPILERPSGGSRKEIMKLDFGRFEPADGWEVDWKRDTIPGRFVRSSHLTLPGAVEFHQEFAMDNGDCVEVVYRLFADDPSVDVEAILDSVGDATPYSLALPFTLPESGSASWHFDTAGAIVEFDREQLPNACRHFVTAGKFVRMQTDSAALSIATPDLPLWKFGGMFFALSSQLDPAARQPAMLAWLANNYWEVNFLANQKGRSRSRFRLLPHSPESIDTSYVRALPYAVPPNLHAYREMGPVRHESETLFHINGDGVALQAIVRDGADLVVTLLNLRDEVNGITFASSVVTWKSASLAKLDGTPISPLLQSKTGAWIVDIGSRSLVAIRLFDAK